MKAPVMYGKFHLIFLAVLFPSAVLLAWKMRKISRHARIRTIFIVTLGMIGLEIFKQIYLTEKINNGTYDWFHFPFQLCSAEMAAGLMLMNKSQGKTAETFLFAWELPAAVAALLYPQDMLSSDLFLLLHSFLYHGFMVWIALWIGFSEDMDWNDFGRSVILFTIFAGIAEILNVIGMYCGGHPDLFYINPYETCRQPFFGTVAAVCGRRIEIVIYLLMITAGGAGVFWIYRFLHEKRRNDNGNH